MTHVTYRLTAKNRDQLRNPTLGNRLWVTFTVLVRGESRIWNWEFVSGQMTEVGIAVRFDTVLNKTTVEYMMFCKLYYS